MKNFNYYGQELSEADVVRIAKRIQETTNPSVLTREEQELIDDYRLLSRKAQFKVLGLVAKLFDAKFDKD